MIDGNTLIFATCGNPVAQVPRYLEFLGIPFPDEKTVLELCSRA